MNRATLIPLLVTVILPMLWLIAEFRAQKTFRMALGIIAFACALAMIFLMSWVTRITTIQPVSESVHTLLKNTVTQLEDGEVERVLYTLRDLNSSYKPITRIQEEYLKDLDQTAQLMTNRQPLDVNLIENTPFSQGTWSGFWSNEGTNWFFISPNYSNYDVYRDGKPPLTLGLVTVSEDFSTLQFQERDLYRHTLRLQNKYQAQHEIYHLETKKIEKVQTLWKSIPPTPEQLKYTSTFNTNK